MKFQNGEAEGDYSWMLITENICNTKIWVHTEVLNRKNLYS